jgi:hypothetical protein
VCPDRCINPDTLRCLASDGKLGTSANGETISPNSALRSVAKPHLE